MTYWTRLWLATKSLLRDGDVWVNELFSFALPDTKVNQTVSDHVAELYADTKTKCHVCHWFGVAFCLYLSVFVEWHHCQNMFTGKPSPWYVYPLAGIQFAFWLVLVPWAVTHPATVSDLWDWMRQRA